MSLQDIPITTRIQATTTVSATPAMLVGAIVTGAGGATAVITFRNGGSGGTILLTLQATLGGNSTVFTSPYPIRFGTDMHVTVAGAGAEVTTQHLPTT